MAPIKLAERVYVSHHRMMQYCQGSTQADGYSCSGTQRYSDDGSQPLATIYRGDRCHLHNIHKTKKSLPCYVFKPAVTQQIITSQCKSAVIEEDK